MRPSPASERATGCAKALLARQHPLPIPDWQVAGAPCWRADLIVQRASARGTAMASSPSRKRSDGGDETRDEDTHT